MRAREFIVEYITRQELTQVKQSLAKFYSTIGMDIQFSNHFLERCNDPRNGKEISVAEVIRLFREEFKTYGNKLSSLGPDAHGVLMDLGTHLNVSFVINYDYRTRTLDLVAKNIMRKTKYFPNDPTDVELPIR